MKIPDRTSLRKFAILSIVFSSCFLPVLIMAQTADEFLKKGEAAFENDDHVNVIKNIYAYLELARGSISNDAENRLLTVLHYSEDQIYVALKLLKKGHLTSIQSSANLRMGQSPDNAIPQQRKKPKMARPGFPKVNYVKPVQTSPPTNHNRRKGLITVFNNSGIHLVGVISKKGGPKKGRVMPIPHNTKKDLKIRPGIIYTFMDTKTGRVYREITFNDINKGVIEIK